MMHRAETNRNVTPTPQQMPGKSPSARAADAAAGEAGTGTLTEGGFAAGTDSVVISQSAVGIGPRWDRFQDRLRERRKHVITTGSTEESADKYRKAG